MRNTRFVSNTWMCSVKKVFMQKIVTIVFGFAKFKINYLAFVIEVQNCKWWKRVVWAKNISVEHFLTKKWVIRAAMDSVCCTPLYLLIFYRSLVIVGGHFFSLNIFTGVFSDYISISIFLLALYNYIIQNNSNWCNVP